MASKVMRTMCACVLLAGSIEGKLLSAQNTQRAVAVSANERTEMPSSTVTINARDAVLANVLDAISRQAGLSPVYGPAVVRSHSLVTMRVENMPVAEALEIALRGTGVSASVTKTTVLFTRRDGVVGDGSITGTVTDEKTKLPLRGVMVMLDGSNKGVRTQDDGTFRIGSVAAGEHRVAVRLVGYGRQVKTVTVTSDQVATLSFVLDPSVNALDQVVVTGTVAATELKAVPNAITIITAKQIEERGITRIDQLFRGDVPGIFATNGGVNFGNSYGEVTMYVRGATALDGTSAGTSNSTNPIKTYVDGVEMADSKYLSSIDPRSIDRIEILTGPQASTIYGSNAINGVMQIFTKRGTSSVPQLTLGLSSGLVQNNFSPALTPQHDYSGQVSGVGGAISYSAGMSWTYMGAWTPARQSSTLGGFGATRVEYPTMIGKVSGDISMRQSGSRSLQRAVESQGDVAMAATGWYGRSWVPFLTAPTSYELKGQTFGATFGYRPSDWWSHNIVFGQDVANTTSIARGKTFQAPWDTSMSLSQAAVERRSIGYTTTVQAQVAFTRATLSLGADEWQSTSVRYSVRGSNLTSVVPSFLNRGRSHNTGTFAQTQLGFFDQLFVTAGIRGEWNPLYGDEANPNWAPRVGAVFTQELGVVSAKLRTSFGRSTRPPLLYGKTGTWTQSQQYGGFYSVQPNPLLGAETQQGWESGLDLFWGNKGSFILTHYNNTVDRLILRTFSDSLRELTQTGLGCSIGIMYLLGQDGYCYQRLSRYMNFGSIANTGWELQGTMNLGPFTTRGVYSFTKSRVLRVDPTFRSTSGSQGSLAFVPGSTFNGNPEHTWVLDVTYARNGTNVMLNINGVTHIRVDRDDFVYRHLTYGGIRLVENRALYSNNLPVSRQNPGYAIADLNVTQRFAPTMDGTLQIQNLGNTYQTDGDANGQYPTLGRQMKVGLRIHR